MELLSELPLPLVTLLELFSMESSLLRMVLKVLKESLELHLLFSVKRKEILSLPKPRKRKTMVALKLLIQAKWTLRAIIKPQIPKKRTTLTNNR